MVADYLASYINAQTGRQAVAQLFQRQPDGSGEGMGGIRLDNALATRSLPASAFPARLIRRRKHDALHTLLIEDFIRWQAPWQLLLEMDEQHRSEFEVHARTQPMKVAAQYRLYPDIARPDLIDAARVEARLRTTSAREEKPEQALSTDYLELAPDMADQRGEI